MQTPGDDGILIRCDFCGTIWNPYDPSNPHPMVEGHHGSVLCLDCLQQALRESSPAAASISCTLCLRDLPENTPGWSPRPRRPEANPRAWVCGECQAQARRAFGKALGP